MNSPNLPFDATTLADAVKYSFIGVAGGTVTGILTNLVAHEVVTKVLNLDSSSEKDRSRKLVIEAARMFISAGVVAIGVVGASKFARTFDRLSLDPTGGAFFEYSFIVSQGTLIKSLLTFTKDSTNLLTGAPCCSSCASGQKCDGK